MPALAPINPNDFVPEGATSPAPASALPPIDPADFKPEWTEGAIPTLQAAALGAANAPTFGLAGKALAATGAVPTKTQAALAKAHPVASAAGGVGGLVAANLIPGVGEAADVEEGAELLQAKNLIPSNLATAIGEHFVPEVAENAGALAKIAQGAKQGAAIGALFSAGQTGTDLVSSLAIGDPDHAAEHIMESGGMNAFLSAGLGGILGGGFAAGGLLADVLKPGVLRAASAASDALKEQQGSLAMDVIGTTTAQLKRLYGKGDRALDAIKAATGAKGEDWPEVLGNILASPDAVAVNAATGEAEPLITAGDTATTVNAKIQTMRETSGAKLRDLYSMMDAAGPGIAKQDLLDTLEAEAGKLVGDPSAVSTRNQIRRIAAALDENDADFLKPSEIWKLRQNNDADIFRRTTGVMRENVDAELALRSTLNDAIQNYAEELPTLRVRGPDGLFRIKTPAEASGFATTAQDLANGNARYSLWAELGRISDAGAASEAAKAPTGADLASAAFRGAVRGAKGGGILGGIAGHLPLGAAGGAALGAGMRVASTLIGPGMAAHALEAARVLSDVLSDVTPKLREIMQTTVPDAVHTMWDETAPTIGSYLATEPWELPPNATAKDVGELHDRLVAVETNGVLLGELRHTAPSLAAAIANAGRGGASRLRKALPLNPYTGAPGVGGGWQPPRSAIHGYNDYARGSTRGIGYTLGAVATGRATSAMIRGSRDTYPRMASRADSLLAEHLAKNPDVESRRGVRGSLDLWFGTTNPRTSDIVRTVQASTFANNPAPGKTPRSPRSIGQARINRIKAPQQTATSTEGVAMRLGKD